MLNTSEELYNYIIDKVINYKIVIEDSALYAFNAGVPYKDPLFYLHHTSNNMYTILEKYHLNPKLGWICPYDDIGKYQ